MFRVSNKMNKVCTEFRERAKVGKRLQVDKRRQKWSLGLKTEGKKRVPAEQKRWETSFLTGAKAVEEEDVVRVVRKGESWGKTGAEIKRLFSLSYPLLVISIGQLQVEAKKRKEFTNSTTVFKHLSGHRPEQVLAPASRRRKITLDAWELRSSRVHWARRRERIPLMCSSSEGSPPGSALCL